MYQIKTVILVQIKHIYGQKHLIPDVIVTRNSTIGGNLIVNYMERRKELL